MSFNFSPFLLIKSITLPGVPTTICVPDFKDLICGPIFAPPYTGVIFNPLPLHHVSGLMTLWRSQKWGAKYVSLSRGLMHEPALLELSLIHI